MWMCMYVCTYWHILFKSMFNWRITALQYYVGVCHISTSISYRYTHVPSLLNLPPTSNPTPLGTLDLSSRVMQHLSTGCLSLHLAMHMFQCYSLSFSHLLPTVSASLFSLSASPLLPFRLVHQSHLSRFHIHVLIYDICLSLSDLLHSIY